MARKFLILENEILVSSSVDFHRELLPQKFELHKDRNKIFGGGWWYENRREKQFLFYRESVGFGQFNKAKLIELIQTNETIFSMRYEGYTFFYSLAFELHEAYNNKILIPINTPTP